MAVQKLPQLFKENATKQKNSSSKPNQIKKGREGADYFTEGAASSKFKTACSLPAGAKEGSDGEVSPSLHTAALTHPAITAGG